MRPAGGPGASSVPVVLEPGLEQMLELLQVLVEAARFHGLHVDVVVLPVHQQTGLIQLIDGGYPFDDAGPVAASLSFSAEP